MCIRDSIYTFQPILYPIPYHCTINISAAPVLQYNHWASPLSRKDEDSIVIHLVSHGLSRKEAQEHCLRNREIAEYFSANPEAGFTFVVG